MQNSTNDKGNDKKPALSWTTTPTSSTPATKQPASIPITLPAMAPNNGNMTARYVGIFVGGLMFGVVIAWGWSALMHGSASVGTVASSNTANGSPSKKGVTTEPQNNNVAAAVSLNTPDINIETPQRAGQSVAISNVVVSKPTWVVVYDNANGKPGNVLGAQLFFSTRGGTITLLRPTIAGKTYFIGRAVDNGDRKFQKATDKPVTDESGSPVLVSFTAK